MKKLLALLLSLAMIVSLAACGSGSNASTEHKAVVWPNEKTKVVNIICGASPGGNTDAQLRIWTDYMQRTYPGYQFVVENDSNGGGVSAFERVRNAEGDGTTFLWYHNGLDIMRCIGRYDYSMSDFAICGYMVGNQNAYFVVVPKDSPYQTIEDLVADAKARPGEVIFGGQAAASRQILYGSFVKACGAEFSFVDLGSEGPTMTALLGGNCDFSFISYNQSLNYLQSGDVRILAYCGDERAKDHQEYPSLKEIYPEYSNFFNVPFLLGPSKMDAELARAVNASFKDMEKDAKVQESYGTMSQTYIYYDYDKAQELFKRDLAVLEGACKAMGY